MILKVVTQLMMMQGDRFDCDGADNEDEVKKDCLLEFLRP
jgi:hypothetical protein